MNNNIITAVFGALRETKVRPRYRYDQGQVLIVKGVPNLPDFFEVHFANEGDSADATPLIGTPDGVTIPDSYFQSGKTVLAYIYVHDEATDGTTVYKVTIPIINRARPANIDPDPEQADIIAQAIVALNENVGKSEAAAEAAETAQQGAEAARDAAGTSADAAASSAQQSAQSAQSAAQSVTAAAGSASSASQSATAAAASAGQSAQSASDAHTYAVTASDKALEASQSASAASTAAGTATTKATEAATSASNAASSASAAETSESNAADSATAAGASASTANTKAGEAASSASAAAQSATAAGNAQSAAEAAQEGAETAAESVESSAAQISQNKNDIADLKSALNDVVARMPMAITDIDPSDYTAIQKKISDSTGKWYGNSNLRSVIIPIEDVDILEIIANDDNNAVFALLKSNSTTVGNYPDYATGCSKEVVSAGETKKISVPDDANYLYVLKSESTTVHTPQSISGMTLIDVPTVDATLTQSGKAADAKVTGDALNKVGDITTKSFTKTGSANAVLSFQYHLNANEAILVMWEAESRNFLAGLNLYTRDTSSGDNKEILLTNAKINTWYYVAPTQSGEYLRVVASQSGTITVIRANTVYGLIQTNTNNDINIEQTRISEEAVRFEFSKVFTDISTDALEFGLTTATRYQMADKVYAAFHNLSETYSDYVTEVLDAEDEIDDSLNITLTKPWYMSNVSAGDEHTIPIDADGGTYTYTVANESAAYSIRMYKLIQDVPALGNSGGKRKVFITSGVHGNEVMSPINLYLFAKKLCNPDGDADFIKLRSLYDFYILPYVNVFGCRQVTRVNGNLVDINRNYPTDGWTHSSVTPETAATFFANLATCTFSGPTKGSEYETQLQMALIDTIHPNIAIDHHNSGTGSAGNRHQFYTNVINPKLRTTVYRAAMDCTTAFVSNLPEYFGTNYFTILGTGGSPYTLGSANGQRGYWMMYHRGYKTTGTIEIYESINSYNGQEAATKTPYTGDAFNVAFFTLKNTFLHFCEYDMTHPYELPDVTH